MRHASEIIHQSVLLQDIHKAKPKSIFILYSPELLVAPLPRYKSFTIGERVLEGTNLRLESTNRDDNSR